MKQIPPFKYNISIFFLGGGGYQKRKEIFCTPLPPCKILLWQVTVGDRFELRQLLSEIREGVKNNQCGGSTIFFFGGGGRPKLSNLEGEALLNTKPISIF